MKRWKTRVRIIAVLMVFVLCAAGYALADGMTEPNREKALRYEKISRRLIVEDKRKQPGSVYLMGPNDLELIRKKDPVLGETGVWNLSYRAPAGCSVQNVVVELLMTDYADAPTLLYFHEEITDTVTSCKIESAGDYTLLVFVDFSNGSEYFAYDEFTIEDDDAHTSLNEKITEVVRECRVPGDNWQTALNLHDWLTGHAYYDLNYEYYGADGVLLRGYGVCDSYSKAYLMLCREAGVPVSRVTGWAGGSHAWNAIQIDGEWYHVDPTWDDPAGATKAVSGMEGHDYFCLNDELMSLDHTNDRESFSGSCTSLDANWALRTAKAEWKTWKDWNDIGNNIVVIRNGSLQGIEQYSERIRKKLASASDSFTVPCEDSCYVITQYSGGSVSWSYSPAASANATRKWTLLAGVMSRGFPGGLTADIAYDRAGCRFLVTPSGSLFGKASFTVPSYITVIRAHTFEHTGVESVDAKTCSVLEAGAFRNCSALRRIRLPKNCDIDDHAFDGCSEELTIFAPAGGTTQAWAEEEAHHVTFAEDK